MSGTKRILLVGFGNMGKALVRGWLGQGLEPRSIFVADAAPEAREAAQAQGLSAADELSSSDAIDVVVFAIKPQQLDEALGAYRDLASGGATVLSIVAGKRIEQFTAALGGDVPVVRAMPNTPAAIGEGMTVLCANQAASASRRSQCEALMSAAGRVEWVEDERLMDAVTAVSGSGPAYVFLLIESLAEAGRRLGLPADLATRLAVQTVAGAGIYARASEDSAAELRRKVTSAGGTTEAALAILMADNALPSLLIAAVRAAAERGSELSSK
jgi:pyrroline-5-carboxylate reductase